MAPPELPAVPGLAGPPVIANLVVALAMLGWRRWYWFLA